MSRPTPDRRGLTLGALVLCAALFVPSLASAGLYKYRKADGSVLISSERRPDLELVEVIAEDSGGSSSSTSSSSSSSSGSVGDAEDNRNVAEAKRRRRAHRQKSGGNETKEWSDGTVRHARFDDIIREASNHYDVPFHFIKAVVRIESNFTPEAISYAGAMGLMQLMPKTADYLNVTDPFDPRQNIFGGTKLLRILIDRYDGDINLILSAYNAGDAAVAEYDGIPYQQTRRYVASVYRWYKRYSRQSEGDSE